MGETSWGRWVPEWSLSIIWEEPLSLSFATFFTFSIPSLPEDRSHPPLIFCPVYKRFSTINFLGLLNICIYIVLNSLMTPSHFQNPQDSVWAKKVTERAEFYKVRGHSPSSRPHSLFPLSPSPGSLGAEVEGGKPGQPVMSGSLNTLFLH